MVTKQYVKRRQFLLKISPKLFWMGKTEIVEFAFSYNKYIKEITIPDTITKIHRAAFASSPLEKVELSKNVEIICRSAFEDTNIKEITIPSSVKEIQKNAFWYCQYLENVEFNEGLETIGNQAFFNTKLTSVKFPKTIEKISEDAFRNKQLSTIEFPDKQIEIHKKAFGYENNIQHIKFGETEIHLSKNEMFAYIKTLPSDDKFFILIYNNETEKFCGITANGRQEYTINEVNKYDDNEITMDIIYFWNSVKQKSNSKTVQKSKLPPYHILSAIGKNEELINAYYQTRSNGISKLENLDSFNFSLYANGRREIVKLFILLGGCEDNASYQARVLSLFEKMLNSDNLSNINHFSHNSFIPQGLDCIREKVTEYAHDEKNKVIVENGFAKIKSEKTVQYHKQLLKLFEENYNNKVFVQKSDEIITNFPKIYKAYKKRLASLNPARNTNGNEKEYNELKSRGLDFKFICEYFTNEKLVFKNKELKDIAYILSATSHGQKTIDTYDSYLTEAKQITKKATSKKKRIKVFMENVVDNSHNEIKYFWPPITSVVALTIGNTFNTCYKVGGANEAGLINVISNPEDNILLVMNEKNQPIAYCRISYDSSNKGILIDNIELDKNKSFSEEEKIEIWNTCVRALKDMKKAMNVDGKYPVERIHCKADGYNKVLKTIYNNYPTIYDLPGSKSLEERTYSTNKKIDHQQYSGGYSSLCQIIIDSPEYELWSSLQSQTER